MKSKARYCRKRLVSPELFHPKSFRVIPLSREKGVKGIIGCPKKYYSVRSGKCKVGTRMQSMLYPVGHGKCSRPGMELNPVFGLAQMKKRRRNPHLTGDIEAQLHFIYRGLKLLGFSKMSIRKTMLKLNTPSKIYRMYREMEGIVGEDI